MKTKIIHFTHRKDRRENVHRLLRQASAFSEASIQHAFAPVWEQERERRAIIGSSVSALLAYEDCRNEDLCLVLEDDAKLTSDFTIPRLPMGCGACLLGGETPNVFPSSHEGFYEVEDPWFGAHAVLFNVPTLEENNFLEAAYKALAMHDISPRGACWEGVITGVMRTLGLKTLRREHMDFTTIDSPSERSEIPVPPRQMLSASESHSYRVEQSHPVQRAPESPIREFKP
ncbi:MAG: hypothetical protein ACQKBY_09765 [Verrucomicrobiales bacterium]